MSINNKSTFGVAGVGVAVAAWLGASLYGAGVAESEIRNFAARPSAETGMRVSNLQHSKGLLSSSGSFGVEIVNQCATGPDERGPTLEVQYSLSHLILPTAPMRVEWSLRPTGELESLLASAFGPGLKLNGQGDVSFSGDLRSTMALPELAVESDGSKLTIAPSGGTVLVGKTAFGLDWKIDRLVARGGGQALELGQIALNADLQDRVLGTGSTSLSIEKIATSHGSAEGFRHATLVRENNGRIDATITENLRGGSFAGKTVKDFVIEFAIKDLDKQSIATLSRLLSDTCGLQNITVEEDSRYREALRTLITQGFSFGIPKVAGSVDSGSVEGKLMLEASKASGLKGPIALASLFRSNGELLVKGDILTADQKKTVLEMGAAQEIPGALKASFEYGDGMLRTNGRVFDGSTVQEALKGADSALNHFLDTPRVARSAAAASVIDEEADIIEAEEATLEAEVAEEAPAPAAPAPVAALPAAPQPAQAPAAVPAPAPASPTECPNAGQCLQETLKAAAREDIDSVRAIATRIDALPKPDQGNRAVSRKFNAEGLEALKAEDAVGAVELFRKGLAENPRDVEIAGNLGFALVKAGQPAEAAKVLTLALRLDPRRSSTWTPLAEALALAGMKEQSQAALWVAFQWSGNRDKSLAFYADRAAKEQASRPALAELYSSVLPWVTEGRRPPLSALAAG